MTELLYNQIVSILTQTRDKMEKEHGKDMYGLCIPSSVIIAEKIKDLGFNYLGYFEEGKTQLDVKTITTPCVRIVEGWCKFDDENYGSDVPYDPHTWVELYVDSEMWYVDVTADQFNFPMYEDFPKVIFQKNLPHGMAYEEPIYDDED